MRVKNSINNARWGIIYQILHAALGFVFRTVFIAILGAEYLGVNSLFTSILKWLALAELGIDMTVVYSLYSPVAQKDTQKIQAYLNLYKKAYMIVALIIFVIGIAIIPFLPFFLGELTVVTQPIMIYLLFLLNTVISYFFIYKQSIFIANQQQYVINKAKSIFFIISQLAQISLLILTRNFILVLSVQVLLKVGENFWISYLADQRFPFIKDNDEKLSDSDKRKFFKNMYAMFMYKIGQVVVGATDNIIISVFNGIIAVGLYANYLMITNILNQTIHTIFSGMRASIGNINAIESVQRKRQIFDVVFFMSFLFYGISSVILYNVINLFITFWLNETFLLSNFTVIIIVINYYTSGMQSAAASYRDTTGLFRVGQYRPVISAVLNLIISLLLARPLGIAGVLLGTVISRAMVFFWFDPYVIFKHIFQQSLIPYFKKYAIYAAVILFLNYTSSIVLPMISTGWLPADFIVHSSISGLYAMSMIAVLYHRKPEFSYLYDTTRRLLRSRIIKKSEKTE
jgi:O-antigen/teichoic acid export membrane protein